MIPAGSGVMRPAFSLGWRDPEGPDPRQRPRSRTGRRAARVPEAASATPP